MNRRAFLGSLVGGVAATAAVQSWPFRVFSFSKEIIIPRHELLSLRFVRTYDPLQGRIVSRWDALFGFKVLPNDKLALPSGLEVAEVLHADTGKLKDRELQDFIDSQVSRHSAFPLPVEFLRDVQRETKSPCVFGWDMTKKEGATWPASQ